MQRLLIILIALAMAFPMTAQKKTAAKGKAKTTAVSKSKSKDSKKVTDMKNRRSNAQGQLKKSQQALKNNKLEQEEKKKQIAAIEQQIQTRVKHIHTLEERLDSTEQLISHLEHERDSLNIQLDHKKQHYAQAVRYARAQRLTLAPMMFALAGDTPSEMVRRMRYAKQYATFQLQLGQAVMSKRDEVLDAHNRMLREKANMDRLLHEIISQRKKLGDDRQRQQDVLNGLATKEKSIENDIKKQQKQIAELDREIERQIAYEIEQARKKAEEEARRKAAAQQKASQGQAGKGTTRKNTTTATNSNNSSNNWQTSEDRTLSGSFERNKGRLPVPITGSYMITQRFGRYTPEGAHGVVLESNGVSYSGQPGARARAIFDGVVTAVLDMHGSHHVLVRHGQYISVYCNLSSVIVKKGQKVHARDLLGGVARDEKGLNTLQFQLHKEKTPLNPALWIGK